MMYQNLNRTGVSAPKCCRKCEYYKPHWKYRFCYYTSCPYGLKKRTIRKVPLKKEYFPPKEVVNV